MVNRSKQKGTSWESAIVDYLRAYGWPHVERRTLNGALDRGDIAGIPGVVIEAKSVKTITLATFVDEAEKEGANDKADVAVAWIKRRGRSTADYGYVVMQGNQFAWLLKEAGYHPDSGDAEPPSGTVEKLDMPLPPENYEGCTCPGRCNIHDGDHR